MSCFITDADTIGRIAAFAAEHKRAAYVKYHFDRAGAGEPEDILLDVAEELARLNAESVAARYDEDFSDMTNFPGPHPGYVDVDEYVGEAQVSAAAHHRLPGVTNERKVKDLARDVMSFEYQSCEAPEWDERGKPGLDWIKTQLLGLLVREDR